MDQFMDTSIEPTKQRRTETERADAHQIPSSVPMGLLRHCWALGASCRDVGWEEDFLGVLTYLQGESQWGTRAPPSGKDRKQHLSV